MAETVADQADLVDKLSEVAQAKDMIVCLGAGDITKWAAALAGSIRETRA